MKAKALLLMQGRFFHELTYTGTRLVLSNAQTSGYNEPFSKQNKPISLCEGSVTLR